MKETSPIPQPKTFGPLGNLPLIDKDRPTLSLIKLAEEQGPIFQIHTPAGTTIVVSGHELVKEVCDEERFDKSIEGALRRFARFPVTDYLQAGRMSLTGEKRTIF